LGSGELIKAKRNTILIWKIIERSRITKKIKGLE
jgi:hypothetical protein